MLLSMLRAKLHRATVTECDLHYEGSISIDEELREAAGLLIGEEVHIWNISNGARVQTYVIHEERGSGKIGINGAAARHFAKGDHVIIAAFAQMEMEEAKAYKPTVVLVSPENTIDKVIVE